MTENRYKTMLENILLSMFTYDNLPNGLTGEYIEKILLRYGNI